MLFRSAGSNGVLRKAWRRAVELLAQGAAGDGQRVEFKQRPQFAQQRGHAACGVEVLHVVLARGLEVEQNGRIARHPVQRIEVETKLRPGFTAGDVFEAHARVMDDHGMARHRLNACGYSLGAKFTPSWMDSPMFYRGNPHPIAAGMVFFAHMILMDSSSGLAMTLGRTSLVGASGAEPLSKASLEALVVA